MPIQKYVCPCACCLPSVFPPKENPLASFFVLPARYYRKTSDFRVIGQLNRDMIKRESEHKRRNIIRRPIVPAYAPKTGHPCPPPQPTSLPNASAFPRSKSKCMPKVFEKCVPSVASLKIQFLALRLAASSSSKKSPSQ
ncbi:hypothetical protein BGZ63DRAFT_128464 [Mariannaea sp. PMI_226]|nr:hypothetical protein BGZ63DRAFT_128464 [Mariannaea sp. PMI_226]